MPRCRALRQDPRERFYARNARSTTFTRNPGFSMRSLSARRTHVLRAAGVPLALRSCAAECLAVTFRVAAYAAVLALMAVGMIKAYRSVEARIADWAPELGGMAAPLTDSPAPPSRMAAAFDVSLVDMANITAIYNILRLADGGRQDVVRWVSTASGTPLAGLRVNRPHGGLDAYDPVAAAVAAGLQPAQAADARAAGILDTKFGPVPLFDFVAANGAATGCLGFAREIQRPVLRIEGWSCHAGPAAVRRQAIACLLDRLVLFNAGNDARLAELFARAELRRTGCAPGAAAAQTADWLSNPAEPRLRGAL